MRESAGERRRGFSVGFALSGLLAAAATYFAFDYGVFDGPAWRNALAAVVIGGASAFVMIAVDKWIERRFAPGVAVRRGLAAGAWGCPRCGASYVESARVCSDCDVPLERAGAGA